MRMYPNSLRDLASGWAKGALSGAGNTPRSGLIRVSAWLSSMNMGLIALALLPFTTTPAQAVAGCAVYLANALQVNTFLRRAGTYSPLTALAYPVPLVFYQFIFFRALTQKKRGKRTQWKGRNVG